MQFWQLLAQAQGDGGSAIAMFALGLLLVSLFFFLLWVFALVDAIKNPALDNNERLIWVLVIVLTNWIGALIYLVAGRKRRR
jgi:hypothetical protein